MGTDNRIETKCLSSLTKVFSDIDLQDRPFTKGSALLNETYSFQVAYRGKRLIKNVLVKVSSPFATGVSVRSVGLVPSELPCHLGHDSIILRSTPGLYPDPLFPIEENGGIVVFPEQWRSVWISIELNEDTEQGIQLIEIIFEDEEGLPIGREVFELEVIPAKLPVQKLIHTEWFHADCLSTHYRVDTFSEEHWALIGKYVKTAADHGMNMILTPLFTPPLDTEEGGERPTVQLVDVEKSGDSYRFGFRKLERWISVCTENGISFFEFSHLFTQWGAKHAPKILGLENGSVKRLFGWETDASGEEYKNFLDQFLPELVSFLKNHGLEEKSYFHVSDEPNLEHQASYQQASEMMTNHLEGFPIIDALSDFSFYEKGLVKNPIPANDHIGPFLENGLENLWTYYCNAQHRLVSNRFFSMPSFRNRVLGIQLYKYNLTGFLHWGYNFWYSQYSRKQIDPFKNTDANYSFPSGDSFLVYPGESGPIESLRLEVLHEAIQDLRALELLESLIGKERVLEIVEDGLDQELTFSTYPLEHSWYLSKRDQINHEIKKFYTR
ncbi:DUF4091 domain-containing protein [Bacillus sp. FJAT-27245]|uniref:DUF4091 domain-containing protein n=1 Tax=Bacillus sp. FJAT-27245 TaxID=1684144 RepID=UPI0006A76741|nr:DUF4091 domain-containing protein [Bacillus sp. FJAT-27245]